MVSLPAGDGEETELRFAETDVDKSDRMDVDINEDPGDDSLRRGRDTRRRVDAMWMSRLAEKTDKFNNSDPSSDDRERPKSP
jgi:hypothetical protein